MADPGADQARVDLSRLLNGLDANAIVLQRVELFRTVGRSDQMKHCNVASAQRALSQYTSMATC